MNPQISKPCLMARLFHRLQQLKDGCKSLSLALPQLARKNPLLPRQGTSIEIS